MQEIQSIETLTAKRCQACEGGVPKYSRDEAVEQLKLLGDTWQLSEDGLMITRQ